jgi:hypothetical protein
MSSSFLKSLIRNRTIITAIVNAAVTWVILIIAPLGLFAVIICTVGVFLSSLLIGNLSDRALLFLIGNSDQQDLASPQTGSVLDSDSMRSDQQAPITDWKSIGSPSPQEQIKKFLK